MVLLNFQNSQKNNKKIKYRGNFQESFEILSLENPFWLPRRVLRKFQGKWSSELKQPLKQMELKIEPARIKILLKRCWNQAIF